MKKIIILLFLLVEFCQLSLAQKHMKFMGIPIDGNVSSFCNSLANKGFTKQNRATKEIVTFKGDFFGQDAIVDVNFDPNSKIVYSVNVSIVKNFGFELTVIQKEIMDIIEEKYSVKKELKNSQLKQFDYYILDGLDPIGMIQTYILDSQTIESLNESMLTIIYLDVENYLKIANRKRNDI